MKPLKHQEISRQLAAEISSRNAATGARIPSEAQLVKRFRVSRPTVARALRDLQELGLIERRAGSGTYVKNPRGGSAGSASLHQFGLILSSVRHTEIFESISGELASLCRAHDYGLIWEGAARSFNLEKEMSIEEVENLCNRMIEQRVAGVFFVPIEFAVDSEAANERIVTALHKAGIPVVLIDRDIGPFPRRSELDLVGVDNFAGGHALATHLIKLGARRLAYVTRPHTASTVGGRIAGARTAMLDQNLLPPRDFVRVGDPTDAKFVKSLVQPRLFDAFLCTSDHVAAQLLQSLNRLGVQTPTDIRLVGFDDMRIASLLTIPLTTMAQPCRDIALTAFNAMRERVSEPTLPARSFVLTPRLIVRESCGAYIGRE